MLHRSSRCITIHLGVRHQAMRTLRQQRGSRLAGTFLTFACWITSLSQQSPATHSVSGKTDSWIIREAGIPGSDDTCPARGLHTTLGFSMNIGYGKIVAKANRNFTHSLIEDNENSQFFEKLSDYSGPPRATCPDFESHHSGE